jgi:uncharacterized protein (DUF1015 family)
MAELVPFKALRPQKQYVKAVASPPYDVLNREEAQKIAEGNPLSFLHVEKSEIDLPDDIVAPDIAIYEKARSNLDKLIRDGILFREKQACLYIYAQEMQGYRQFGIVGGISVVEYERGKIKKHELTREDKELDRTRHVDTVNAHTGPVFITYRARPQINRLVADEVAKPPEYEFVADDGVSHSVWILDEEEKIKFIVREFTDIGTLYIADGHHRAAAAAAVAKLRRGKSPVAPSTGYENILAVLFPHTQLHIMDYNRVVGDLNDLSAAGFLAACGKDFTVSGDFKAKSPHRVHEFGLYLDGAWYKLAAKSGTYDNADPIGSLDVSILQERLLAPILAVNDPRTDKRIAFVGGVRGMQELERLVDEKKFAVAFAMYPPTIDQLMTVADAGEIMPPKSTWFEPKLRSGIFTHLLDKRIHRD